MSSGDLAVCIVGAGPRGLSVLERICAHERKSASHRSVTVHVVDPARPGPGAVWRTDQSPRLLMNTVASQVTVYTDASVEMDGPVETGPSLYEWAAVELRAPDRAPGPDDYPSRALYGRYLQAAFDRLVATAPPHVSVRVHRARALTLDDGDDTSAARGPNDTDTDIAGPAPRQTLTLSDGLTLTGIDAVVLAQGHVAARPAPDEQEFADACARQGLVLLPRANPADLDLSVVRPGEPVLLRGLGLNFFDHMALLTEGRGGTYARVAGRLVYRPSHREPRLFAGSRRGVPYHARGENEKGAYGRHLPRLLTPDAVARLRERAAAGDPAGFGTDLWPLIDTEVRSVYYGALLAADGRADLREEFVAAYLATPRGPAESALLDAYGIHPRERWDWERIARPYGDRKFADRSAYRAWLLGHLAEDVREARRGNVGGPLKAALDVLRDLRNEVRLAVDHGGIDGGSYRDELDGWYTPFNGFLSIGPPASRIEELIALIEAGVVELLGPGMSVRVGDGAFVAESDRVGGEPVRARVLIDARLPEPDLRRTADPLLGHLLATGQCRPYVIAGASGSARARGPAAASGSADAPGAAGTPGTSDALGSADASRSTGAPGAAYETGGLAVTERPYRVVDAQGRPHPRRFAYGVPTEAVHWVTAAGIRPGVNSVTLGDSDAIARAVLALTPLAPPAAPTPPTPGSLVPPQDGGGDRAGRPGIDLTEMVT